MIGGREQIEMEEGWDADIRLFAEGASHCVQRMKSLLINKTLWIIKDILSK
jgi:hypothetical protein